MYSLYYMIRMSCFEKQLEYKSTIIVTRENTWFWHCKVNNKIDSIICVYIVHV